MASYALWAASRSFGVFLLSRIIGGISKGNVSLSTAVIADLHSPKARSKGMVSCTCGADVWVYWLTFNWFQVLWVCSSAACSLIKWKHDLPYCLAFENVPDGLAGELSRYLLVAFTSKWNADVQEVEKLPAQVVKPSLLLLTLILIIIAEELKGLLSQNGPVLVTGAHL